MAKVPRVDSVAIGLAVIVAITIATSYTTLAELALFAGWGERMAWLFPASLDVLALVSCRIWLSAKYPPAARSYAKGVTIGASALSVAGNGVGHLASTGHIGASLWLVVAVGCVAPVSLTVVVHLTSLANNPVPGRKARHKAAETTVTATKQERVEDRIVPGPTKPKNEKPKPKSTPHASRDLFAEAQEADREHRQQYGTGISRNKLRAAIGVGQGTASDLIERLKEEEEVA